jgi:hypothetical protein
MNMMRHQAVVAHSEVCMMRSDISEYTDCCFARQARGHFIVPQFHAEIQDNDGDFGNQDFGNQDRGIKEDLTCPLTRTH